MTNPIINYTTLTSAIVDLGEDDSQELRDYLPVAIANAENRLARELSHEINEYTSTVVLSASVATLTKPSGHKLTHRVTFIDSNNRTYPLTRKEESYLDEYWKHDTSVATPKYYADINRTTLRICPATSAAGTVKIKGERRPTPLTSTNSVNAYTSVCPDALFYATLMEVAIWQRNDTLLNNAGSMYISTRDNLNTEGIRQRRDSGSSFRFSPTNTIINALKNPE